MPPLCIADDCRRYVVIVSTGECQGHYRQRTNKTKEFKGYKPLGHRTQYNQECEVPGCTTLTKLARLCAACRKKTTRYGLTQDEVIALPQVCEACGEEERLHVDHDHSTGKYRGILCGKCNTALGLLDESAKRLEALGEYIKTHKTVQ